MSEGDGMRECPNPKCGSDDHQYDLWAAPSLGDPDGDWSTGCTCCGMSGPVMPTKQAAIDAWNECPRGSTSARDESRLRAEAAAVLAGLDELERHGYGEVVYRELRGRLRAALAGGGEG